MAICAHATYVFPSFRFIPLLPSHLPLPSLFLSPSLLPLASPVRAATRALVPGGGAYAFAFPGPNALPPPLLEAFYGSQAAALENMPLALLQRAPEELVRGLPEMFVLRAEHDPDVLVKGNEEFVEALEARVGRKVKYGVQARHSHISPSLALLTGDGEEWGEEVAQWVKERIAA